MPRSSALKKLYYHSDCTFFAGCENMLPVFFGSAAIAAEYEIFFGYRKCHAYKTGLNQRVSKIPQTKALPLPDLPETQTTRNFIINCAFLAFRFLRPILHFFILLYDVLYLYCFFLKVRPNLVHINNGGYPGAISPRATVLAAKMFGKCKILFVVNNLASGYTRWGRWFDYPVDCLIARWVDIFVTGSRVAKAQLEKVLHLPNGKVQSIPNGIEMPSISRPSHLIRNEIMGEKYEGVLLGVVARLERRKGHHVLIQAIRLLHESHLITPTQVHFIFKGDGPAYAELINLVARNSIESYVTIITETQNPAAILAALDVVILPSVANEDFPFVILEAMALGKAIIATNIAGIPEQIISEVSGLLVQPNDPKKMASAISCLLNNPKRTKELGAGALLRFKNNFTSERSARKYLALYNQLLS